MSALQFVKVPFKESLKVDFTRTSADAKPVLLPGAMRNKSLKAIAALKPAKGTGFTYFYLIVDYFKNDKGVSEGHYLGFGKKPDVFKHLKKMMKGNGSKFFGAGDGKNVAIGEAYMDTDASGADIMYFNPDGACKMKIPAWNKAFKVISKKYLKMACALAPVDVVFATDPEMVAADEAAGAVGAGTTAAAAPAEPATPAFDPAAIMAKFNAVKASLKTTIPPLVPKLNNKSISDAELASVQEFLGNVDSFLTLYDSAPDKIKAQLANARTTFLKYQTGIRAKVDGLGAAAGVAAGAAAGAAAETNDLDMASLFQDDPELAALLADAEALVKEADQTKTEVEKELSENSEPLPAGQAMLDGLGI